jgi:hypothetical protein
MGEKSELGEQQSQLATQEESAIKEALKSLKSLVSESIRTGLAKPGHYRIS